MFTRIRITKRDYSMFDFSGLFTPSFTFYVMGTFVSFLGLYTCSSIVYSSLPVFWYRLLFIPFPLQSSHSSASAHSPSGSLLRRPSKPSPSSTPSPPSAAWAVEYAHSSSGLWMHSSSSAPARRFVRMYGHLWPCIRDFMLWRVSMGEFFLSLYLEGEKHGGLAFSVGIHYHQSIKSIIH